MEPLKTLNAAMNYIEENLYEDISFSKIAEIALCSEYHFKGMFSFLSGMPLSEYIRKRRLSDCISLLRYDKRKIIDIALLCGYTSPDAFTKAFTAHHGITPSQARSHNAQIKAFPPITFQLKVYGGASMEYRIVEKDKFYIAGVSKEITLQYHGVNHQMDSLWEQLTPEKIVELKSLCDTDPSGIVCVSADFTEERAEGSQLTQYVGVAVSKTPIPPGYDILEVSPAVWAVFTAVGKFPEALQSVWARIYSEWFPTSGYELTAGPEILWNESPDTSLENYRSEIWIPVVKK